MDETLKQHLGVAREAVGQYGWNFSFLLEGEKLRETVKRKLYKRFLQHADLWTVHRNGNISLTAKSDVAPKALAIADSIIQALVERYQGRGLVLTEINRLSVL